MRNLIQPPPSIINSPSGRLVDSTFAITDRAAHVRPVGAILIKHVGFAVPIGERRYDREPISAEAELLRDRGELKCVRPGHPGRR